jgi:hypothetical protein
MLQKYYVENSVKSFSRNFGYYNGDTKNVNGM